MRPPRPDFDWTRLNDGEMPLEELQRIDVAVSRPVDEYGGVAADQVATGYDGLGLIPAGLRMLWVRLTSLYTAEGPLALYNFEQVVFDANVAVTVEGGVTGVALETSGNDGLLTSDVDPDGVGTIVQAWPGEDSLDGAEGEKWRFTSDKGGNGDTFNYTDSTTNYYGTNVTNIYETWNWTIYDGGTWYVGGPGYIIFEAPFKIYGGLWFNYRDHDFAGASQVDDLGIDTDDPQRVVLRITIDQDCLLTGLVATPDSGAGQVVVVVNTDPTFTLTLASMNFASAGGNRIACPGLVDLALTPGSSAMLWYDPFVSVWRVIGFCCGTGTGGGGGTTGLTSERSYYQPARWYYGGHPPDVLTSNFGIQSNGQLYAFPFLSGPGGVIDQVGMQIGAVVAGGAINIAIYDNDTPDLRPKSRIYDSGPLSTNSALQIVSLPGIGVTLDPDEIYWLAFQCSSSSIQPRGASCNDMWPVLGSNPASGVGAAQAVGWGANYTYTGALPLSWPASTTPYAPNNSTAAFMVGLKFTSVNAPTTGGSGGGGGPIDGTTPTTLVGILQGDGGVVGTVTVGSGLTYSGGTLSATGGGTGTVTSVATGTGLTGGPITTTGTVSLANTAVAAGTYGDSTHVATFTVDAQGRLTAAGTAAISAGAGYTDEQAQDAVANALTNSLRIQWTYNDTLNQISADIFNYSITDQQIRYAAGTSVIGRAVGGASGPVADIAATADGQVLTRVAGALTWAAPATGGTGTVTSVAATAPAAGLTITGSPITTSGTLTFALANDLAALEALTGTNTIYYRSGTSTWTAVGISAGLAFSGGILEALALQPAGLTTHQVGYCPDPGTTAHTPPYVLCDDATWKPLRAQDLAGTRVSAYLSSNQSIVANASSWTTIQFDNEVNDALGEYNPSTWTFTPAQTGTYLIDFYCAAGGFTTTGRNIVSVWIGTSSSVLSFSDTTGTNGLGATFLVNLTGGTGYTFRVLPLWTGTMTANGGAANTYLEIRRFY